MLEVLVDVSTISKSGSSIDIDGALEITVINKSESDYLYYGIGGVAAIPLLPLEERKHTAPVNAKYMGLLTVKSEEKTCDLLVLQTRLINEETA